MHINGATALVTGANRGLGKRLVEQLIERGAAKVYGAVRRPETVTTPGVTAIHLDITDRRQSQPRPPSRTTSRS
jgi:NAD(P)-dependent dehydrogenase (short-subunit alcohol dehydrogenase family)